MNSIYQWKSITIYEGVRLHAARNSSPGGGGITELTKSGLLEPMDNAYCNTYYIQSKNSLINRLWMVMAHCKNLSGHVCRRTDGRWTKEVLSFLPAIGVRLQGHPVQRWTDGIYGYLSRGRGDARGPRWTRSEKAQSTTKTLLINWPTGRRILILETLLYHPINWQEQSKTTLLLLQLLQQHSMGKKWLSECNFIS